METTEFILPDDLKECIAFHGHLCPGLVYGYRVAKAAMNLLKLHRSEDEEVVAVCENDSCAVDALQVLLGTTAGKGNLDIKNYGKNAYTILNRSTQKAYRFSRLKQYRYTGPEKEEFGRLEEFFSSDTGTDADKWRFKLLKSADLLSKPLDAIFSVHEVEFVEPPYAPLARSKSCARCGEMTMSTRMVVTDNRTHICIPCSETPE
ncbi:FmdE family protein [Thermodesulfobacteriota bacterium]